MALTLNASDARVLFNLGLALELKGDLSEALSAFRNAMSSDPKYAKAQKNIERIEALLATSKTEVSQIQGTYDQSYSKKSKNSA